MAAILKEILDRVEMPQQTEDARLLSILCDEADKSMILQLEADELIPYSVLAETGNAIKKYLGVPSVKIYPKYAPELFSPSYLYDIIQILKPSHGVINGYMDDSDLTATDSARPGVYTVPLSVTFADGTGGLDGVELTADEFYAHLKVDKVPPRTSQPSPQSFMTIFEDAKENGDQVIAILISSNLSGTYQCARLAAESCDFEDVFFVDSRTASQGEAILVREALRLRDEEHLPAHAIVAELEQLKQRIRVLAVVDSLKHLHKGGRLPAAVALVGGALGVKPVLSVVDGQIKLADTARGRPGAFVAMFKNIEKMGGVDPRYGYALLYSDEKGVLAPLHHYMHENLHMTGGRVARLGPVIASHAGPGCAGLVFVTKE